MKAYLQEMRELGFQRSLFRIGWELKTRLGLGDFFAPSVRPLTAEASEAAVRRFTGLRSFTHPDEVRASMEGLIPATDIHRLTERVDEAMEGKIWCFGRSVGFYGNPIDWYLEPVTRRRWDPSRPAARALREGSAVGDVKLTWEAARFPHAYDVARAATFVPDCGRRWMVLLGRQIREFDAACAPGRGIHWASSQEVVFRLMAWAFAASTAVARGGGEDLVRWVAELANQAGPRILRDLAYSRHAVYNNHLLSEALGLILVARILPESKGSGEALRLGLELVGEQCEKQVYRDGGYIQNSHNYHRLALQVLLWARTWIGGDPSPVREGIDRALARSLDFLWSHQDPVTGRLPNFGANDGALPSPLSSCDFANFRPTLQAVSLAVRGERLYPPGPWDEEACWFLGSEVLRRPIGTARQTSRSFSTSGYHVLRGDDAASFGCFRCGTLLDRFSQIDMLHLDVWWKGMNVLADAGSYQYNGPAHWNAHFHRTGSHNTITVDGRDQMLHLRRFKSVYRTTAKLNRFVEGAGWVLADGEHFGFQRHPGGVVHRRQVVFAKEGFWVVVDLIAGNGSHEARLQWLGGAGRWTAGPGAALCLETSQGPFTVAVYDGAGQPRAGSVMEGVENPPRGWLSRSYQEKVPAPSLVVEVRTACPIVFVSVLAPGQPELEVSGDRWTIRAGGRPLGFRLENGVVGDVSRS